MHTGNVQLTGSGGKNAIVSITSKKCVDLNSSIFIQEDFDMNDKFAEAMLDNQRVRK